MVIPGLATRLEVNPDDFTRWIFTLREGVTFHDGAPFDAAAVVWNVEKVLNQEATHFAPDQVGETTSRMPTLRSASAIDDYTVELVTSQPDAFLPLNMTMLFMASPVRWQALCDAVDPAVTDAGERAAVAWTAFAADPSGTGPFMGDLLVPRERFEMVRNPNYWDPARTPTIDRVVLVPLPEARTSFDGVARDAALARPCRRRGAVPVGRQRCRPAGNVACGGQRRPAQELVHRHRAHDEVRIIFRNPEPSRAMGP